MARFGDECINMPKSKKISETKDKISLDNNAVLFSESCDVVYLNNSFILDNNSSQQNKYFNEDGTYTVYDFPNPDDINAVFKTQTFDEFDNLLSEAITPWGMDNLYTWTTKYNEDGSYSVTFSNDIDANDVVWVKQYDKSGTEIVICENVNTEYGSPEFICRIFNLDKPDILKIYLDKYNITYDIYGRAIEFLPADTVSTLYSYSICYFENNTFDVSVYNKGIQNEPIVICSYSKDGVLSKSCDSSPISFCFVSQPKTSTEENTEVKQIKNTIVDNLKNTFLTMSIFKSVHC